MEGGRAELAGQRHTAGGREGLAVRREPTLQPASPSPRVHYSTTRPRWKPQPMRAGRAVEHVGVGVLALFALAQRGGRRIGEPRRRIRRGWSSATCGGWGDGGGADQRRVARDMEETQRRFEKVMEAGGRPWKLGEGHGSWGKTMEAHLVRDELLLIELLRIAPPQRRAQRKRPHAVKCEQTDDADGDVTRDRVVRK